MNIVLNDYRCLWLVILSVFLISIKTTAQSYNYWTRSFNEESSLLSGAVVGGGAGPSAIYYNPASISEVVASKFTLNASLFSFKFYDAENAMGEGIDLNATKGIIEPRFLSYMIKSKRHPNWSYEIAFLNNQNIKSGLISSVDEQLDILTHVPGIERYFAVYQFQTQYRDDWMGGGGSVKLSDNLYAGASMFLTIRSLEYENSLEIEAYSLDDSIFINNQFVPFYIASYQNTEYLKFNDYRLLWKAGILYKTKTLSLGLSITTPSVGIYSDGKRVTRKEKQSNITQPADGEPIPDYIIADYKEKEDVDVAYKSPLSLSAGLTYNLPDHKRTVYTSVEYFFGLDPYRMVEANESPDLADPLVGNTLLSSEWLTFVSGAKPLLNAAIGYSWTLKKGLLLMAGFRTDFNYRKNLKYGSYSEYAKMQGLDIDLYHITGGLSWRVFGQDIITGLEYSVGGNKNQLQIANLSDPVEYNTTEKLPLQGTRNNTMDVLYNSISFYFGASFNFGGEKDKK
jgi:hypothetical protein